MVCKPFSFVGDDGTVSYGFACGPRRPRKRCACGRWATKECDFPAPHRKSKTCDKPLCDVCAIRIAPNVDHCPDHPRQPAPLLGGRCRRHGCDEPTVGDGLCAEHLDEAADLESQQQSLERGP